VILIALLSLATWLVFGGQHALTQLHLAMVTVLLSPVPVHWPSPRLTAIMVGIGKGAENGILIRDAEALEMYQGDRDRKLIKRVMINRRETQCSPTRSWSRLSRY